MSTLQNNIINELGLDKLPEETRMNILSKMTESVLKRIAVTVLEKLSEEDREEFEKLQESATPEDIDKFLEGKIDDYSVMVERIITEFKDEMKESVDNIKKTLE